MKISVIVVTYNQQDTISRTLDSILAQQCSMPFEIVVGDDCSTDNTRTVCESFAQRYPDIVRLMPKAPNKGVVRNYFDCLLECRGEYIADCAGDDFWTDTMKLQKECDVLEDNPEVTLVHTGWQYYDELSHTMRANTFRPFPEPITDGRLMLEAVLTQNENIVVHSCTMMYRAAVARMCYDNIARMFSLADLPCEDLPLIFMLAREGRVAYLPECTLAYSVGHSSVSTCNDERRQFQFAMRTARLSHRLAAMHAMRSAALDRFFSGKVFALLMHSFRCNDKAMRDTALACMAEWGVVADSKISIAKFVMSDDVLWSFAIELRKVYVELKKL